MAAGSPVLTHVLSSMLAIIRPRLGTIMPLIRRWGTQCATVCYLQGPGGGAIWCGIWAPGTTFTCKSGRYDAACWPQYHCPQYLVLSVSAYYRTIASIDHVLIITIGQQQPNENTDTAISHGLGWFIFIKLITVGCWNQLPAYLHPFIMFLQATL